MNAPEKLYLRLHSTGQPYPDWHIYNNEEHWTYIKYIRADLAAEQNKRLIEELLRLRELVGCQEDIDSIDRVLAKEKQ